MARTLARFTITDAGDDYMLHIEDEAGETIEITATYEQLDLIAGAQAGVRVDAGDQALVAVNRGDDLRFRAERFDDLDGRPDHVIEFGDVGRAAQAEVLRTDAEVDLLAAAALQLLIELRVRANTEARAGDLAVLNGADQKVHSR